MKKNNSQSLEVLEPEVEDIPLEQVIDNTLVKHNVTDAVINSLKEKYGTVRLKSIDDKESFLEVKDARKNVRSVGILVEKVCKKGREDAIAIQKKWLKKEDEIMDRIMEIQLPLDDDIEKFENEVERKELLAAKLREEKYINRQSALSKMGAIYDNGSFVLNHISYEVELIKQADEDMWNDTILPKYKKEFEANEASRVAEENKRKEELEKMLADKIELERQQKAFKEQQELFLQQQAEMQRQKDEILRQERLEQEKKDTEERLKSQKRIENRYDQLYALGMKFNSQYGCFAFEDVNVDNKTEINLFNDEEWAALIEKITPIIEQRKNDLEEKRLALLEHQKQDAIKKALEESEIKRQQEEQRKLEELALSSDKEKYADVVKYLKNTPSHAMKSSIYKGKMNIISDFIQDL